MLAAAVALALAAAPPGAEVEQARLMQTLTSLPTRRAARGDIEHQLGLAATEEFLAEHLRALGYEPVLDPLTWNLQFESTLPGPRRAPESTDELRTRTWHNIIVEIPGRDLAREVLILGAHFDAVPGTPGADDNGTGTAALLEIARVLKDRPMRRTVRLIFFNLEEVGLLGSAEYVRRNRARWEAQEETVIGMASLEMLGYFTDAPGSQRTPIPPIEGLWDPPTVGDFIALATTSKHVEFLRTLDRGMHAAEPGIRTIAPEFLPDVPLAPPDMHRSDHFPFLVVGLPAVMVTDTSNYRNPNYHKPSDTADTLDPTRFGRVVTALAGAAWQIAEPVQRQE